MSGAARPFPPDLLLAGAVPLWHVRQSSRYDALSQFALAAAIPVVPGVGWDVVTTVAVEWQLSHAGVAARVDGAYGSVNPGGLTNMSFRKSVIPSTWVPVGRLAPVPDRWQAVVQFEPAPLML